MDIPRGEAELVKRKRRRLLFGAAGIAGVLLVTLGLSRLGPAVPGVERASVLVDTVKRGSMLREVRGPGTLVPEDVRWIPATTEGRVEKIVVLPGAVVKPDTVVLELSNPEVTLALRDAQLQLSAAEAELANQKVNLDTQHLDQRASAAKMESEYQQARLKADVDEEMATQGLISQLTVKLSRVTAQETKQRNELEKERLSINDKARLSGLKVQEARVAQLRAAADLRQSQVDALKVRAGIPGVLQLVPVAVGQRVTQGTNLARVADPARLKAELKIPETQAKDVVIGQPATVDTRNGVVKGRVVRVDPAVLNGTVTVDVTFVEPLPRGARPDLSVDGTIELERLEDILYVGRPAFGQEKSTVGLFKLVGRGPDATLVRVKLGRSSVNAVEIVEGLSAGDQVILSDTSAYDAHPRIRLK
jgi:HlyD family secretion protein